MVKMDKDQCDIMEEAMRQIGWAPGSEIPMANEENLKLLESLRDLMVRKTDLTDELEDTNSVLEKLRRHCDNTEESVNSNLALLDAHQSELRNENHLQKMAERQSSKLKQIIRDSAKEYESCKKHVENTEKELCKRKRNIDQRTNRLQWAKTALLEWREAIAQGQRGFELLQKYSKEDEVRARQLDKKRQNLIAEIAKYRQELVNLYDEQKSLEQNLERTANLYRTAHIERRQMVETWKAAVQTMTQRENDIENSETHLAHLKLKAKERGNTLKQHNDKLNDIIDNNHSVEMAIEELNSETSDIKSQLQEMQDLIILRENDLEILTKELQNLTNRVQQQRAANRQNAKERKLKLEQLANFDNVLRDLQERLEAMQNQNMNAQQRLMILEDLIDTEDKSHKQITKETNRTNDLIYRSQLKLTEFKDEGKILVINNDGLRVTIQAVEKNSRDLDHELRRLTEVHYDLAFKCLEVERKIIKQMGGVLDPEVEQRNMEYLAQLEEYNTVMNKRLATTEAQNKRLDDNMRALTACYNNDNKTLEVMHFDIKEAQVYCEGGIKRLKSETHKNQMLIVDLSILKLRVKEFENDIIKCEDSVYNLEQHRAHLQRTIKDRIIEIKSQLEVLYLKRKHMNEERSTLRADIAERTSKIEAVRARFELTTKLLGTNEDGSLVTATQLRVETAQEKQLLLEEGNELNERVLKAEREIKALENTLRMFTCSNDNYRKSVQSKDDSDAAEELKALNENFCKAICMLKLARSKYLQIDRDIQTLLEDKAMLETEIDICTKKIIANEADEIVWYDSKEVKPETFESELLQLCYSETTLDTEIKVGNTLLKYIIPELKYETKNNEESSINTAEDKHTDLIPGVYEGGAKLWECTLDLISYLEDNPVELKGKRTLDLGCGCGLLGIYALKQGAIVHFQDYNEDVLQNITIPNVVLNLDESPETSYKEMLTKTKFYSGDWSKYIQLTLNDDKFDFIMTSETIYNSQNQKKLLEAFAEKLNKNGIIYVAAKTYYFGVGGGLREFEELIKMDKRFSSRVKWISTDGVKREIVELTFKTES